MADEEKPLLQINVWDEKQPPEIFYQGEEITGKKHVHLNWDTDTLYMGGLSYTIEHYEAGDKLTYSKIERRTKKHALNLQG